MSVQPMAGLIGFPLTYGAWFRSTVPQISPDNTGNPPESYEWKNTSPTQAGGLRLYEAHVGMAQEEGRVGTFLEFSQNILPRIVNLGYNAFS